MSWQIPTQIEQDIIAGTANYRTFQTGNGGQSILTVPPNSYVVIFGYDLSPAGGGFSSYDDLPSTFSSVLNIATIRQFETQQISFYTGNDFFPFIHHIDVNSTITPRVTDATVINSNLVTIYRREQTINNSPISRQIYITSANDITITHGLILNSIRASANAIPVTNRTPTGLTYGGSAQLINTQTNYGPNASPLQFMQPSPKDYQDFAFGLLPNNADGQAFATPDPAANGLYDSSFALNGISGTFVDTAACNYFLCLHYAIYSKTIPEQRG